MGFECFHVIHIIVVVATRRRAEVARSRNRLRRGDHVFRFAGVWFVGCFAPRQRAKLETVPDHGRLFVDPRLNAHERLQLKRPLLVRGGCAQMELLQVGIVAVRSASKCLGRACKQSFDSLCC